MCTPIFGFKHRHSPGSNYSNARHYEHVTRMKATLHQRKYLPSAGLTVCEAVMASGNPVPLVHTEQHLGRGRDQLPCLMTGLNPDCLLAVSASCFWIGIKLISPLSLTEYSLGV